MENELEKQTNEINNVQTYVEVVQEGTGTVSDVADVVATAVQTTLAKCDKKSNVAIYRVQGPFELQAPAYHQIC